jgi:hypothetical protein
VCVCVTARSIARSQELRSFISALLVDEIRLEQLPTLHAHFQLGKEVSARLLSVSHGAHRQRCLEEERRWQMRLTDLTDEREQRHVADGEAEAMVRPVCLALTALPVVVIVSYMS